MAGARAASEAHLVEASAAAKGVFKVFVEPFLQLNIDDYTVVDGSIVRYIRVCLFVGGG